MQLLVVGVNHKTTPIELRETMALPGDEGVDVARALLGSDGIREAMTVSTCNRVELYIAADRAHVAERGVLDALSARAGVSSAEIEKHTYVHVDEDAVHHIFRVCSSLDSMVVGEPQITGQVKDAYRAAQRVDAVGSQLDQCLRHAFRVAKRVRNDTEIGENAVSMAFLAVELARQIFGSLAGKRGLLVGAGQMSAVAARHLSQHGAELVITNRSRKRAHDLADELGGSARPLEALPTLLTEADIVVSSTSAPGWVLTHESMTGIMKARRNRPLFLIDLAVPRDIEPRVNTISNVYLYDVDDMQRVLEQNKAARQRAAGEAARLVRGEVQAFMRRLRRADVVPTIVGIREKFHDVAEAEFDHFVKKSGELDPAVERAVRGLTRRVVNKLLHDPMVGLKRASESGDAGDLVDAIHTLFALEDATEREPPPATSAQGDAEKVTAKA